MNGLNASDKAANKSIYTSLLVVFCMVLITLSEPLMAWVWVLCVCAVTIAYIRILRNLPSVKNITLNLLAIFCMVLLIYLSSNFGLIATMVNLLVVAACLKLINLNGRTDYHLVLIVVFFLIACGFIYHQSIYIVAYYFACIVVLFVTAFLINKGDLNLPNSIKQSSKMIIQAIPITLVLFVVTPRLPPFWQTNVESSTQTGLSEELTPGDIANLAQSSELVFRAEFDDAVPSPQERYWRSIVLDYFDGITWRITGDSETFSPHVMPFPQTTDSTLSIPMAYRYLIIAQPNNTRWLYSLDIPFIEENMGTTPINMNRQYQLFQPLKSKSASLYITRSYTTIALNNFLPETDFARYLQTPLEDNLRTQAWVKQNISNDMSFNKKISIINGYFVNNPFSYTLKPPLMPSSPVDAFLFDNQQGFCSHYASALTYMLRLAEIPARMVAGYQGGEEQGENILTIRQYDAHAWVEAYDNEKGWIRFDPTALVAPNRTLSGLISALNAQESAMFSDEIHGLFNSPIFDGMRETLGIIDHNWNQFVLEFNNDAQGSLIKDLFGELSKRNLTTFLLVALAIIGIFLAILFLPYHKWLNRKPPSALQKLLLLLSKRGFVRNRHESLQQFYIRIEPTLSQEMKDALSKFVKRYYEAAYQNTMPIPEEELFSLYTQIAKIAKLKTPKPG